MTKTENGIVVAVWVRVIGISLLCALFLSLLLISGCQAIGPTAQISRDKTALQASGPVTLQIEDADKKGVATGPGPARFTSITGDEVQTMQSGTTPRDLFIKFGADGSRQVNLSSGTDILAKGVEFDALTGSFKVSEFGTSASAPIRAGNEAYDRLVVLWKSISQDQRDAVIEQIKAAELIAPDVKELILGVLTGL